MMSKIYHGMFFVKMKRSISILLYCSLLHTRPIFRSKRIKVNMIYISSQSVLNCKNVNNNNNNDDEWNGRPFESAANKSIYLTRSVRLCCVRFNWYCFCFWRLLLFMLLRLYNNINFTDGNMFQKFKARTRTHQQ